MAVDFGTGYVRILPDLTKFTPALTEGVVGAGTAAEAKIQAQMEGIAASAVSSSTKVSASVKKSASESSASWTSAAAKIRAAAESLTAGVIESSREAAAGSASSAVQISTAWQSAGSAAGNAFRAAFEPGFTALNAGTFAAAERAEAAFAAAGIRASTRWVAAFDRGLAVMVAKGEAAAVKLGTEFEGVRATLTGLFTGAIALGGLDIATRGAVEYAHGLLQISNAYNISSEEAARFRAMMEVIGVKVETVLPTFARLTKAAADSDSSISKALDRWGISVENFRNADITGQLELLAAGYKEAGDQQKQFISDILGGRGTRIAPLFAQYEELASKVKEINFPIPSHDDIFAMSLFDVQMGNLVRTIELKVIPVAIALRKEIIALLLVWATTKTYKLIRSMTLFVTEAMGSLAAVIRLVTTRNAELVVSDEAVMTAEMEAAAASRARAVAMLATWKSMAKTTAIVAALVVGLTDIIHAIKGIDEAYKDLNIGEDLKKKLEDVALNDTSFLDRFKKNVVGIFSGKGPNEAFHEETAANFAAFIDEATKAGLDKVEATGIASKAVDRALAQGVRLSDESIQSWTKHAIEMAAAAEEARHKQFDLSATMTEATSVLDRYGDVVADVDLTSQDALQSAAKSYADFRDTVADNLNFVFSDLDALADKTGLSAQGIARHLDLQLREMTTFADSLSTIAADGSEGATALVKHLQEMGTEGYNMAYKIAHASSDVRKHIEDNIGKALGQSQDAAASLEEQLVGGFTRIAAAILIATDKATSWADAMKQVGGMDFPDVAAPNNSYITGPRMRATGGPIEPNVPYIVGERGPEWFKSSTRGDIVPASQMRGSGGRVELVITNWESGKGYIRHLARDEAAVHDTYQTQLSRMRR